MTDIERITRDTIGPSRDGHELRYRLAAGYINVADTVLDAACGIGYGASLCGHAGQWVGVDITPCVDELYEPFGTWLTADLNTWEPDWPFDVAVSFETLEHLERPDHLLDILARARRLVVCSVPIVPTAGANPHHLHDFTLWDLPRAFDARGWRLHQFLLQPAELAGIYLFAR